MIAVRYCYAVSTTACSVVYNSAMHEVPTTVLRGIRCYETVVTGSLSVYCALLALRRCYAMSTWLRASTMQSRLHRGTELPLFCGGSFERVLFPRHYNFEETLSNIKARLMRLLAL